MQLYKNKVNNLFNLIKITLNVGLKPLSYTLAQRLKKILPKLINEDQTGYIKNRFIGFNLRQIQDIIDYSKIYKIFQKLLIL